MKKPLTKQESADSPEEEKEKDDNDDHSEPQSAPNNGTLNVDVMYASARYPVSTEHGAAH
jgi:hypothetical protein